MEKISIKATEKMQSTQNVINWFGNRGVPLSAKSLKFWSWSNGALYYIVKGSGEDIDTENGYVDLTHTHRDDGTAISCFELYNSFTLSKYEAIAAMNADLKPLPARLKP